jgi:hypothetical protein
VACHFPLTPFLELGFTIPLPWGVRQTNSLRILGREGIVASALIGAPARGKVAGLPSAEARPKTKPGKATAHL